MNSNREFTLRILKIVRDNTYYTNRMREAQRHMAFAIADDAVNNFPPQEYLVYAYNYFKERAWR